MNLCPFFNIFPVDIGNYITTPNLSGFLVTFLNNKISHQIKK